MAPKGSSKRGEKGSRSGGASAAKDEDEKQINLGDSTNIKHALDEAATEAVLSHEYHEDTFVSNVKIGLGIVSGMDQKREELENHKRVKTLKIALALVAQFWPGKFHSNWWLVFWCVVAYMVITVVLAVFCAVKEGSAILFTKPSKGKLALKVSSKLPRFSDMYTLRIESASKGSNRVPVETTKSITNYFHSDGYLSAATFQTDVVKLLHSFEDKD